MPQISSNYSLLVAADGPRRFLKPRPPALVRWFLNAPIPLYRLGLGFVFGHRLLLLVHRGRKSGRTLSTPLEVVTYDPRRQESVVIAPWRAEWLKNIEASPAIEIWIGRDHFRPVQRLLTPKEVAAVLDAYGRKCRVEASGIARLLGWRRDLLAPDRDRIASQIYGVAFTPAASS